MDKPRGNGAGAEPGPVSIDARLAERLVAALERIGTAFSAEEANDAQTLAARLASQDGDRRPRATADPARTRAARDYDVLRGLLGRAGAPRPLSMHRERTRDGTAGGDNAVVFDSAVPVSASYAVVESPGDAVSGPQTDVVPIDLVDVTGAPTTSVRLQLRDVTSTMPISRVELFDKRDALVAFGPSLAPLPAPSVTY